MRCYCLSKKNIILKRLQQDTENNFNTLRVRAALWKYTRLDHWNMSLVNTKQKIYAVRLLSIFLLLLRILTLFFYPENGNSNPWNVFLSTNFLFICDAELWHYWSANVVYIELWKNWMRMTSRGKVRQGEHTIHCTDNIYPSLE
jgi:hypothetical protein